MTLTRLLLGAAAVAGLAGSAAGQGTVSPWPEPEPPVGRYARAEPQPAKLPDVAAPAGQAPPPTATGVLTAPPGPAPAAHPQGTVTSPWCGSNGCCGPYGGHSPITYELYTRTGPGVVWGTTLASHLNFGWNVTGGFRTLVFNDPGDAAWVLDLGLGYTYNRGKSGRFVGVNTPRVQQNFDANGNVVSVTQLPEIPASYRVRGLSRTGINFGLGRDWWFNGPGFLPAMQSTNWRIGADVGGRWGNGHVDLVPEENTRQYLRRDGTYHGVYIGAHANWEIPVGSWIATIGGRVEYDYTFMNFIPPRAGDLQGVNFHMTFGWRF